MYAIITPCLNQRCGVFFMKLKRTEFNRGYHEVENILNLVREFGGVIAGGYARYCASPLEEPAKASDIDVFTNSEDQYNDLRAECVNARGWRVVAETDLAITFSGEGRRANLPFQIIKPKQYNTVEELLSQFDFTVAQAAIDADSKRVLYSEDFEKDELAKNLVICNINNPIQTLDRILKYADRGYGIKPTEYVKLFEAWDALSAEDKSKFKNSLDKIKEYLPQPKKELWGGFTRGIIDTGRIATYYDYAEAAPTPVELDNG